MKHIKCEIPQKLYQPQAIALKLCNRTRSIRSV